MWELDHKEGWALNNWCFWTVVLEKTLGSPLDCTEIKPVNPKGNQFWIFLGRTDTEAVAPILWPPDAKNLLIGKDSDAGKDWRQEEKGMTEDEMVGWHHRLNGHAFEQALGYGEGQGSLAAFHGVTKSWIRLSDWTRTNLCAWICEYIWHLEVILDFSLLCTTCSIPRLYYSSAISALSSLWKQAKMP